MMDVIDAIKQRESVRSYKNMPVEDKKLQLLLEAARLAPSASNRQEWRFVVVTDQEARQKLVVAASNQGFVAEAPVVIAACAETDNHVMKCGQLCYPIDVAIAIDHITLKAVEEGLGTCWIGAFDEKAVKAILKIPQDIRVVSLLTVGYPKTLHSKKTRNKLDEIVRYESWS
jgi:nitroreductase